jgi:hypothetical protein
LQQLSILPKYLHHQQTSQHICNSCQSCPTFPIISRPANRFATAVNTAKLSPSPEEQPTDL